MVEDASAEDPSGKVQWLRATQSGFGEIPADVEFLHESAGTSACSATETWWFEVIEPERGLIASFYIAIRPNLGVCSAGSWMWRGTCLEQIQADHLNYQVYLPAPRFEGSRITVPNVGLSFDIIEPLQQMHIRYAPKDLDCRADLSVRALMLPAMRANGRHFEQAIWVSGEIRIGGELYRIDGPSFRDRSWGEARPEDQIAHPPIGWLCGNLEGGRAAFNLSGCDDPTAQPIWGSLYDIDPKKAFFDGWLMLDGDLRRVVSMSRRTQRTPTERLRPCRIEVDFMDDRGQAHALQGLPRSSYWMHHWPNLNAWFGLTDWVLDGMRGFGEAQEYAWPDYARRIWPKGS
jgi:hypothetical protein